MSEETNETTEAVLLPDDEFLHRTEETSRKKTELAALGKRLMLTFPLLLLIGYPVVFILAYLFYILGLQSVLDGDLGYFINFIANDVFVRGSYILLCYNMLKKHLAVKYEDKSTGFKPYELFFWLPIMIMLGVCGSFITNFFSTLVQLWGGSGEIPEALESVKPEGPFMFVCYLVFVGVTGPILEEVLFRGIFLRALRPYGDMLAIIVTSAMFGLFHLNFSQVLYTSFIGIVLAAVAVRSNSLIPSIILHIANNLMVTFVKYSDIAMSGNEIPTTADTVLTTITSVINLLLSATPFLALGGLLMLVQLKKYNVGDAFPELSGGSRALLLVKNKAAVFCLIVVAALVYYSNFM